MKYNPLAMAALVAITLATAPACKKNSSASPATGCITRYQPDISKRILPQGQYDSVKQFFGANGLSLDTLQPLSFYPSPAGSNGGIYYQVPARKLVNGLPVLNGYLKYDFYNGILNDVDLTVYNLPLETTDTTAHLSLDSVRSIFLASNPDSYANSGFLVAVPGHKTHWADSCIFATLQYSDKSTLDCCTQGPHVLVKVWNIQRAPDTNPMAIIDDKTGTIYPSIYFTLN